MTRSPGLEEHPVIAPKLAVTVLRAPAEPARVVALMPGLGTAVSGTWDRTAEHLAADSHVIALDLPGHGRSPAWDAAGEAPSMEWLARATDATIEAELEEAALNGLPLHFAGISLAGGLALQLALDHAGGSHPQLSSVQQRRSATHRPGPTVPKLCARTGPCH